MATDATRTDLAGEYATQALYVSVHDADPGPTGANEVSGVARQAISWTATDPGVLEAATTTFTFAGATDLTHVGIWDSLTGGAFVDSMPNSVSLPSGGDYAMDLIYTQS